jgi:hypothetical protein
VIFRYIKTRGFGMAKSNTRLEAELWCFVKLLNCSSNSTEKISSIYIKKNFSTVVLKRNITPHSTRILVRSEL